MNPRRLNRRIDVLARGTRSDQKTGESIDSFEALHKGVPAMIVGAAGGQSLRGQQVDERANAVVTIRHMTGLNSTMRIKDDEGKLYKIVVPPLDRDGKRRWLELQCSEVTP